MEVDGAIRRVWPGPASLTTKRWLALIVLIGALLRFVPITFGLPLDRARPDEEVAIGRALGMVGGDLNPHFFDWGSLTLYLFALSFSAAAWIHDHVAPSGPLAVSDYYIVARAIVMIAGSLTIVVLFRLARIVTDDVTAAIAAFFLAVVPLHVRESHFAMTDTLMTFLATLALLLLVRAFHEAADGSGQRSQVLIGFAAAGLTAGLATATKYSAGALAAPMAVAQVLLVPRAVADSRWWRIWMPSAVFLGAMILGFLVGTPYAVLDYPAFSEGVLFDIQHLASGHGPDLGAAWIYHATRTLPAGLGVPICLAAIVGVFALVKQRWRDALIVLVFCAALYGSMANGRTVFFRYVLPLVPAICLSAAAGVRWAAAWLAARTRLAPATVAAVAAVAVAATASVNSVRFDQLLSRTDTRVLAGSWLAAQVKPDESVYDSGEQGYQRVFLGNVRAHIWRIGTSDVAAKIFLEPGGQTPDWLVLPQSPLEAYTPVPDELRRLAAERYDLATTIRAASEPDPGIYDPQDGFFLPIARFEAILRPGPTVAIYRKRPVAAR